jgi:DNA-directed RNA polymerase sigma subunit (sigma70/sigma32)
MQASLKWQCKILPSRNGGRSERARTFEPRTTHFTKSHITAENNDTAMKVYLREIGRIPLLTPQQEIELASKIKEGDRKARELSATAAAIFL